MAELERIANHLGDFGAICNDASFVMMQAQCGMLREAVASLRCRLWPPLDDGSCRPRREFESISLPRVLREGQACSEIRGVFRNLSNSMTRPLRCKTAPSKPEF